VRSGCGAPRRGLLQRRREVVHADDDERASKGGGGGMYDCDMARTGFVPMPHPTVLVHARSYESGQARLAPPPADSRPSVSASVVWGASAAPKSPVGTYELVLASYSSPVPSDRGIPDFQHVLSWVVIGHHVPFVGGSATGTSPNAIPHRPCFFATVLEPFNATTGKEMVLAEGTL
jgi:hypothetical protein